MTGSTGSFAANGAIPPYKPFNIAGIFPIEATPILETAVSTVAEVAQGVIFGSGEKEIILPNTGAQLLETITLAPLNSVPSSSEAIARKVFSRFSTPRSPVVFMVVSAIALIALSAYVIYRIYYRKTTSLMLREPQREPVEDLQLNDAVACNIQKRVEKKKTQLALADQNIGNVVTSVDINNQSAKQTVSSNSSVSSSPQHLIRAWRTPLGRYYGMPIFISRSDRNGASPLPQFTGFLSTTPKDSSMQQDTPGPTNLSEKPLLGSGTVGEDSVSRFYTDQTLANAASSRSESDSLDSLTNPSKMSLPHPRILAEHLFSPIVNQDRFSWFDTDQTLANAAPSRPESDSLDSRTIPLTEPLEKTLLKTSVLVQHRFSPIVNQDRFSLLGTAQPPINDPSSRSRGGSSEPKKEESNKSNLVLHLVDDPSISNRPSGTPSTIPSSSPLPPTEPHVSEYGNPSDSTWNQGDKANLVLPETPSGSDSLSLSPRHEPLPSSRTNFSDRRETSSSSGSGGTSARSNTNDVFLNTDHPISDPRTTATPDAPLYGDPQQKHLFPDRRMTPITTPRSDNTPRFSTNIRLSGDGKHGSESARSIPSWALIQSQLNGGPSESMVQTARGINRTFELLRTIPLSPDETDLSGSRFPKPLGSSQFSSIATQSFTGEGSGPPKQGVKDKPLPSSNRFYRSSTSLLPGDKKDPTPKQSNNQEANSTVRLSQTKEAQSSKNNSGGVTQIAVNSKKPVELFRRTLTSKQTSVNSDADTAARLSSSKRLLETETKFNRLSSSRFPRTSIPFPTQPKRTSLSSNRLSETVTKATSLSSSHFSRSSTPFLTEFRRSPSSFNRFSGTVEGARMNSGRFSSSLTPVPTQPKRSLSNSNRLSRTATEITRVSSSRFPRTSTPLQTQPKRSQSADQPKNQRKISLPETVPPVNPTPLSRTATGKTERYKKTHSALSNKSSESVKKPWGSGIPKRSENSNDPLHWVQPEEFQNIPPRYREAKGEKPQGFENMISQREVAFGFMNFQKMRDLFAYVGKAMDEVTEMKKFNGQLYVPEKMSKRIVNRAKELYNWEHPPH